MKETLLSPMNCEGGKSNRKRDHWILQSLKTKLKSWEKKMKSNCSLFDSKYFVTFEEKAETRCLLILVVSQINIFNCLYIKNWWHFC